MRSPEVPTPMDGESLEAYKARLQEYIAALLYELAESPDPPDWVLALRTLQR